MPRKYRIDELWNHRIVVTDDTRKKLLARAQFSDLVQTELVFDRKGFIPGFPKFAKSTWVIHIFDRDSNRNRANPVIPSKLPLVAELFQVCYYRSLGHRMRLGRDVSVNPRDDFLWVGGAGAHGLQNILFTLETV